MRARCISFSQLAGLPRTSLLCGAVRVCAWALVGLCMAGWISTLRAQDGPSSPTSQAQSSSSAHDKQGSSDSPSAPAAKSRSSAPSGEQGDQSLQADPLANPVNPPPTPEIPAVDDPGYNAGEPSDVDDDGPEMQPSQPAAARPAAARPAAALPVPLAVPLRETAEAPPPAPVPAKASDPHRQKINDQCANLLGMANALKAEVKKTTQDELSVAVVRQANQIERLARQVRDEMRPVLAKQ